MMTICGVCGARSLDGKNLRWMRAPEPRYDGEYLIIRACPFCVPAMERGRWTHVAPISPEAMDFDSGMEDESKRLLGQQLTQWNGSGASPDVTWNDSITTLPARKDAR